MVPVVLARESFLLAQESGQDGLVEPGANPKLAARSQATVDGRDEEVLADRVPLIALRDEGVDGLDGPEFAGDGEEGRGAEIGHIDFEGAAPQLGPLEERAKVVRGAEYLLPGDTGSPPDPLALLKIPVGLTADFLLREGDHEIPAGDTGS